MAVNDAEASREGYWPVQPDVVPPSGVWYVLVHCLAQLLRVLCMSGQALLGVFQANACASLLLASA